MKRYEASPKFRSMAAVPTYWGRKAQLKYALAKLRNANARRLAAK